MGANAALIGVREQHGLLEHPDRFDHLA